MPAERRPRHAANRSPERERWLFTVNNPQNWRPEWNADVMAFMCFQMEVAPQTGTPHVQGYVRFKTRRSLETAKAFLHPTAHLEIAYGTERQNWEYCSKEGGSETTMYGQYDPDQGKQGRRTDLTQIAEACRQRVPIRDIAAEWPGDYIRYHAGIDRLHQVLAPPIPAERPVHVVILWGPTATGKTHRVRTTYPGLYSIRAGRGPFDGYNDEATVLFDEFRFENWPIDDMNMYCDKWPAVLNCRYRDKHAAWTNVFICSNSDPDGWYPNVGADLRAAFFRRVHAIYEVTSQNDHIIL